MIKNGVDVKYVSAELMNLANNLDNIENFEDVDIDYLATSLKKLIGEITALQGIDAEMVTLMHETMNNMNKLAIKLEYYVQRKEAETR